MKELAILEELECWDALNILGIRDILVAHLVTVKCQIFRVSRIFVQQPPEVIIPLMFSCNNA
jgi:hypothetical protein